MLLGPVFNREVVIAPRRSRIYLVRTIYPSALLVLIFTAWLLLTLVQLVRDLGDLARFGAILFQILAILQLVLTVFASAMLSASAVAQEKDKRTFELLLLTNLSDVELVLGKLLASLLGVLVMLVAALPLLMLVALLGGVSYGQIGQVYAVTLASVLAAGSLGSTMALWREKTFQALAGTALILVSYLAVGELVAAGVFGGGACGLSCQQWAAGLSPRLAVLEAVRPAVHPLPALGPLQTPANLFLLVSGGIFVVLNGIAMLRLRVWNPPRESRDAGADRQALAPGGIWPAAEQGTAEAAPAAEAKPAPASLPAGRAPRTRHVWDNPVLWREVRTWAYGRRTLVIRAVYLLLFALAAGSLHWMIVHHQLAAYAGGAAALVPLLLLSLVLVNIQAVTAVTSERDAHALDLLLVTDLSPKEIIFGKLGGVFYNTKEMVVLPMLLCGYLAWAGVMGLENLIYLLGGFGVLLVFTAVLGIHAGMIYANSRSAIATSLGTVFFLFLGVAVCMKMIAAFSGSFQAQLLPFSAMFLVGSVGLYVALGARNPSSAIAWACFLCPVATFYAITSLLLGGTLMVFLIIAATYGFATAAMLIPALYEFDVATGRTTAEEP